MEGNTHFDVIIIGGSYAGLSAAMALGRSLRKVLVIDSGLPCNRFTPHSHNFITHDGAIPAEITKKAKLQVLAYPTVRFCEGRAVSASVRADGYSVLIEGGTLYTGHKLVLAAGVRDILPDIDGFAESWGKTVIHCPYCHGYEFRGKKTGIIAGGERAFHIASLVNNLTGDLTLLTNGNEDFSEAQITKLQEHNISIEREKVVTILQKSGEVKGVVLSDARFLPFEALYAAPSFEQHSDIYRDLGCELTESGHIKVDQFQQTTVNGVFACGDCSGMLRSVAHAVATGNIAGAMVNHQLVQEHF
ncbi:NAD(P)/FAD-dependent oxidoreductase [Sphingobacterium haloxyli]|uniref:Pyridine nucleotide-disulfide oxidoreductase n=1 Tax=Sphingobacterium haloxyli TaxID=2100533 RepID=A0A2S9J4W5_9SPHI|nr:NAD(P)/FAD-dependent oxidoreductase [Sphingobacterium haloxyli]PRD47769.1 pyridine nucleotide-disulfide oxidoreductase [Sphingobacterium haloxyli]